MNQKSRPRVKELCGRNSISKVSGWWGTKRGRVKDLRMGGPEILAEMKGGQG